MGSELVQGRKLHLQTVYPLALTLQRNAVFMGQKFKTHMVHCWSNCLPLWERSRRPNSFWAPVHIWNTTMEFQTPGWASVDAGTAALLLKAHTQQRWHPLVGASHKCAAAWSCRKPRTPRRSVPHWVARPKNLVILHCFHRDFGTQIKTLIWDTSKIHSTTDPPNHLRFIFILSECDTDVFHLLAHSPKPCISWNWARTKQGTRNSIWVSTAGPPAATGRKGKGAARTQILSLRHLKQHFNLLPQMSVPSFCCALQIFNNKHSVFLWDTLKT